MTARPQTDADRVATEVGSPIVFPARIGPLQPVRRRLRGAIIALAEDRLFPFPRSPRADEELAVMIRSRECLRALVASVSESDRAPPMPPRSVGTYR